MTHTDPEYMISPRMCRSEFCGKGPESCPACRFWPEAAAFKGWRERTAAVRPDDTWCPTLYQATRNFQPKGDN